MFGLKRRGCRRHQTDLLFEMKENRTEVGDLIQM
jgi:hypothetical protein